MSTSPLRPQVLISIQRLVCSDLCCKPWDVVSLHKHCLERKLWGLDWSMWRDWVPLLFFFIMFKDEIPFIFLVIKPDFHFKSKQREKSNRVPSIPMAGCMYCGHILELWMRKQTSFFYLCDSISRKKNPSSIIRVKKWVAMMLPASKGVSLSFFFPETMVWISVF